MEHIGQRGSRTARRAGDDDRTSAALGAIELRRPTTAERVAEQLREMILRGEPAAGERLREASLATAFGVSRNTLREAIRGLAREGIVTAPMHQGAVVTRLSAADVADIFHVRRRLELAALQATAGLSSQRLVGLTDAVTRLSVAAARGDWGAVVDSDGVFHQRLVALLASPRLDRFFAGIQAELRLCLSIVDRSAADAETIAAEHAELLQHILDGRTRRCQALLAGHLAEGQQLIEAVVGARAPE